MDVVFNTALLVRRLTLFPNHGQRGSTFFNVVGSEVLKSIPEVDRSSESELNAVGNDETSKFAARRV